jgi:hypothetical protein
LGNGSLVQDHNYVIYEDSGTIFAKNGTTGAVEYESVNMTYLLEELIVSMPNGGSIHIKADDYTLPSDLTIQTPGIVLTGDVAMMRQFVSSATHPTRLIGDINVYSENVKLQNLVVQGTLTFGTTVDLSQQAHYATVTDCSVFGQVVVTGRAGAADAEVPFNIVFLAGEIRANSAIPLLKIVNLGAPMNHLFFYGTTFEQQGTGSCISVSGQCANIAFTSCLFLQPDPALTNPMIDLDDATSTNRVQMVFLGGQHEMADNATLLKIPAIWSGGWAYISFIGFWFPHPLTIIEDDTTSGFIRHTLLFQGCTFLDTPINFNSGYSWHYPVETYVLFDACSFCEYVDVNQYGPALMYGEFRGCQNLNPIGLSATPFTPGAPYMFISLKGSQASPGATYNYTIFDAPIWITSTGGVEVNITIYDARNYMSPTVIITGLTTLNMTYLPVGYSINFGDFSVAPDVIVSFG